MRLINISKLTYVLVGSFFFGLFVWLVGFFGWVLGRDGVGWKGMKVVDGSFGWEGMELGGVLIVEYLLTGWWFVLVREIALRGIRIIIIVV